LIRSIVKLSRCLLACEQANNTQYQNDNSI
jgi:hypothetical protein